MCLKTLQPVRLAGCKAAFWLLGGLGAFLWAPLSCVSAVPGDWFLAGQSEKNGVFSSGGVFSGPSVRVFPTPIFPNSTGSEQ